MITLRILTLVSFGTLQVALPLADSGRQLALCVETVAKRHFSPGGATLLSFPDTEQRISRRTHAKFSMNSELHLMYDTLQSMHEQMLWPMATLSLFYVPLSTEHENYWKMDHCIIFTFSGEEGGNVTDTLDSQVQNLRGNTLWNNKAEFIVVVAENHTHDVRQLALEILNILWKYYSILNVVVLIPQTIRIQPAMDTHDGNIETLIFDLYTWFPYQSETKCADVQDTVLIDSWIAEGEGRFLKEVPLFPAKIHKNFHGCPLKISALDLNPLVIQNNYTGEDNTVRFVYDGPEVECCKFITTALNMTPVYLPVTPSGVQGRVDAITDLADGTTDVAFGAFPLHALVHPFVDSTMPYIDSHMSWYVPCGNPVPRMEKITKIFTVSVWLMIGLAFVSSVIVTWLGAKSTRSECSSYMTVSDSIQNLWAISLGMAAREMPRAATLRPYFCLFIWYCFSISILFQSHFTSVLVNPGVRERITTLEELYRSDLVYHYVHDNDDYLKFSLPSYYSEIKLRRTECRVSDHCLHALLRSQTLAVIEHSFHADYITSVIKKPELCMLDVAIYRLSFAMHLAQGSHLVDTFNDIIYRILQGGLIGKWWNDLKTKYKLSSYDESSLSHYYAEFNDGDSDYFVFSVSHLQFAFYAVGMGGFLGFLVLMAEILHYKFFKKPRVLTHAHKIKHGQSSYQTVIT